MNKNYSERTKMNNIYKYDRKKSKLKGLKEYFKETFNSRKIIEFMFVGFWVACAAIMILLLLFALCFNILILTSALIMGSIAELNGEVVFGISPTLILLTLAGLISFIILVWKTTPLVKVEDGKWNK